MTNKFKLTSPPIRDLQITLYPLAYILHIPIVIEVGGMHISVYLRLKTQTIPCLTASWKLRGEFIYIWCKHIFFYVSGDRDGTIVGKNPRAEEIIRLFITLVTERDFSNSDKLHFVQKSRWKSCAAYTILQMFNSMAITSGPLSNTSNEISISGVILGALFQTLR